MSTVVRPSGPLPPHVYWVRRLLLLLIVVLLVWGVTRVFGGDDAASGESAPPPDAGETSTEPVEEATDEGPTAREIRRERQRARRERQAEQRRLIRVQDVSQSLGAPAVPCDLTLVEVLPQVPEPAYAGSSVLLRLGLRTSQPEPCTLTLDAQRLLLSVTADGETVWSSECRTAVPARTVALRPFWTSTLDLQWSGQRSGRRCAATDNYVEPGDYELQAAALTGEPAVAAFTLTDPAPVEPVRPPAGEEQDEAGGDAQAADGDAQDAGDVDARDGEPQDGEARDRDGRGRDGVVEPGDEALDDGGTGGGADGDAGATGG